MKPRLMYVLACVAMCALLSSCGRGKTNPDLTLVVSNASGITNGAPVEWRGMNVGSICAVDMDAEGVRLGIALQEERKDTFRHGLRGRAISGLLTGNQPVVELYGGTDAAQPVLAPGASIPEASALETFRSGRAAWMAGAGVLLLVIGFFLKGVKKLVGLVIALALLAISGWVIMKQWNRHKHEFGGAEIEAKASELANKYIRSPAAAEAWRQIRADVGDLSKDGAKASLDSVGFLKAKIEEAKGNLDTISAGELQSMAEGLSN